MQKIQALKGANQGAAGLQPEAFGQALKGQPKLETLSSFSPTQILSVANVVLSLAGPYYKTKEFINKPKPQAQAQRSKRSKTHKHKLLLQGLPLRGMPQRGPAKDLHCFFEAYRYGAWPFRASCRVKSNVN